MANKDVYFHVVWCPFYSLQVLVMPPCTTQDITGWGENDRGVSYTFGRDVVYDFLRKHRLSLIARAHQV